MHTNRISPARKILFWLGATLGLILLTGCDFNLANLTPASIPENPSSIYTIQARAVPKAATIVPNSLDARLVIDGQEFKMNASTLGEGLYELDYQLPSGRDEIAYYFIVHYKVDRDGSIRDREMYTEVQHTKILKRGASLLANRGPVGARIGVSGRGFTPQDVIYVEGVQARTVFESVNAISFFIPAIDPGKTYRVALGGAGTTTPLGTLRVDPSKLSVSPSSLTLRTGQKTSLSFTLPSPAASGGLLVDVQTDVPDSVIMPEVIVPQGQVTATITVEAGRPGQGNLFVKGFGAGEIVIPVTVTAK
ncbi:MAG: hypothetical protein RL324_1536 [Verrucomicrobiota bacterium]|jgi:hypothetical protein